MARAICKECKQEMIEGDGCTVALFEVGGVDYSRVAWQSELDDQCWRECGCSDDVIRQTRGSNCGDCGVRPGALHHPGCDMERCPKCHRQFISCNCSD